MIEENGTVVAVNGDEAWVQTIRQSTCGTCNARKGCGQGALARLSDGRANQVKVANTAGARVGDPVVLGIGERQLLTASLLVYALPLLALLVGALAGASLGEAGDGPAILGGLLGLASGFLVVRIVAGGASRTARLSPVMLRVDLHHVDAEPTTVRDSDAFRFP
ncbi:SoxR reducing system RseC family protein [Marinobacter bohaiensis]|uniref:SoxR reducing system RseC family protein n=1 Tax=Marinobacter bohaiensis TaxID=2201898 RepID=UPI000DAE99CC|nr:SoxR reducing system RseC family protein [Marinobacter bohaiensis]